MSWLDVLMAFALSAAAAFVAAFLARWQRPADTLPSSSQPFLACLPGYDCGFCGHGTCREYAEAIDARAADPVLCSPGGSRTEAGIRSILEKRPQDPRARRRRAVIRCGGTTGAAALAFDYDNREDCGSAAALYGGPKVCKDGCLGFGSCAAACPLNAIRVRDGCAFVDADRCSGCGACMDACPKGLIELIPADQTWFVACAARMDPQLRIAACAAACDACGECVRRSMTGEFVLADRLARVAHIEYSAGAEIAAHCHSKAIRPNALKKKEGTPSEPAAPGI